MGTIVNRNQEVCCTCLYWGGDRRILTNNFDEVEIECDKPGLCNAPDILERNETQAMHSCHLWKEV